jgi:hypothetical protein
MRTEIRGQRTEDGGRRAEGRGRIIALCALLLAPGAFAGTENIPVNTLNGHVFTTS